MRQASCLLTDLPAPDSIIAWLPAGPVTRNQFLADVRQLAGQLPEGQHVLNICHNRYHFLVGLAAAIVCGKVSLLPSSLTPNTVTRLRHDAPDLFCLHDTSLDDIDLPGIPFPPARAPVEGILAVPEIPADQVVAHVFTSGSTGTALVHRKTWGSLVINALSESERLGARGCTLVGTVPPQHMYGFESTVLICLHGGAACWSGRPFYPADISAALDAVPAPRALVTTPFHLRTLLEAGLRLPPVDFLLSATAPLSEELAARAEAACGAPLLEIYGCTETGQLASRRSTQTRAWQLLGEVTLCATETGHAAQGGHVEGTVPIGDVIELVDERHFLLHGRNADQVNIAGKRTSLAYLNQQLLDVPGVTDGVFFMPDAEPDDHATRLCACVVAPGHTRQSLLAALRSRIDTAFLPRPLVFVERLPRNAASKLPRADLLALLPGTTAGTGTADTPASTRERHWRVPAAHSAFPGHFPGRPILPGVVLIDQAIQLTDGLLPAGCVIRGLGNAKFFEPVGPGTQLVFNYAPASAKALAFEVRTDDRVVASGSLTLGQQT
ncbi:MAG: AMP-binding protein [Zoogloea sp.]|uniref:AMP-binding protein n=1 Tax=Zoogloea sp. TaxID=49181 RepID=UPI00263160BD|nr:AMP-binding protein [Zoogloea sp.]MDD2987811.1 AMP-binding protein [Zoogloea sp.]